MLTTLLHNIFKQTMIHVFQDYLMIVKFNSIGLKNKNIL